MELTKQEKRPRIMITMRCFEHCKYCSTPEVDIPEVDGNYWIDLINSQDYDEVVFSGGEPLLYDDLFMIIDNIKIPVVLYTNLRFWMREYFPLINKDKCKFFVSYHPHSKPDDFIEKTKEIHQEGYNITTHYVDYNKFTQEQLFRIEVVREAFEKIGIPFSAHADQQEMKKILHTRCEFDRNLLGPNGKRYPCMKLLQEQKNEIPLTHYTGIDCDRMDCLACNVEFILKENAWK